LNVHKNPTEKVTTDPKETITSQALWSRYIGNSALECCSIDSANSSQLLPIKTDQHILLSTIDTAFNQHRPLCLSPDDFMLPLVQAAAFYIDLNLTAKTPILGITPGEKKVKLEVRRDDFALGRDNPWQEIFTTFGELIKKDIGEDNYHMLRGNFTTTGIHQAASYDVSLMSACKSHYSYHNVFRCGIPEIHLKGTKEDWENLRSRALKIADFLKISGWKEALDKTIEKITLSREIEPTKENLSFWCNLYRRGHHSGGEHIDGWINIFFPFIRRDAKYQIATSTGNMMGEDMFGGRDVGSFPSSLSFAPVECDDRGNIVQLTYFAGQVGIKWDSSEGSLSPAWGWCIAIDQR
jgi:hypothetical protein